MLDPRYDICLCDPVSGESLGLMVDPSAPLTWASSQPMATRIVQAIDYKSFDQWSLVEQSSWHHGRGLEKWDDTDPERYYDSCNLDTRIRDQVTLAPGYSTGQVGSEGYYYPGTGTLTYFMLSEDNVNQTGYYKKLAQGFMVGSTVSITQVVLRLKVIDTPTPGKYLTLRIETDNSGVPSGTLAHANATTAVLMTTLTSSWSEITFTFTSFNITGSTQYHLVLSHNDDNVHLFVEWQASKDTTDRYISGGLKEQDGLLSTWSANPLGGYYYDAFFTLPGSSNLNGTVSCFCQFNGKMYVGAGKAVYEWDNANSCWVAKKVNFANNVTSMAEFAGLLWVAHSDGNVWTFDGTSTWAEKSSVTATYLRVHKGYLYRSTYSTDNLVYYTADGSAWGTAWKVGNPGRLERITGLAGYQYDMYVTTTHGLYMLGPESNQGDLVDQIKSWASQYDTDNGRGAVSWAKDGKLYIPILGGLLSYYEGLLDSVGPDRDAGLPSGRQGSIVDMLSLTNWLIAAVDCGAAGTSSVLVYNGTGWHELVRIPQANVSCRAVGYDTTTTPHRLWFGYGSLTGYVKLPDVTDNPYQYTGSVYASDGYFITPWISLGLLNVDKDFQEVGVQCEMPASGSLEVQYEVDRSGTWTSLYTIDSDDLGNVYVGTFPFTSAFAANPTVAAGSTIKTVNCSSTAVLTAGCWVRISDEVRQVASITDADTFVLVRPLSAVPAAGTVIYPARACGAEIRFKVILTTSSTAYTPKLQAFWLRAMPMLSDKLAGSFGTTLCDGQTDHMGGEIEASAASRAALLHSFANRPTPVYCYDRRGTSHTVKVTEVRETQTVASEPNAGGLPLVQSYFAVSLVEV